MLCSNEVIDSDGNKKRHLTDEFNYAHFSRITAKNYWFNPQLLTAHPVHVKLFEGDGLIIPAGWWHWIKSEPHTFAVNFWAAETTASSGKTPRRLHAVLDHARVMHAIEAYTGPVRVWNSAQDVFLEPEVANFKDRRIRPNEYIISVKGFEATGTLSPNEELMAAIRPHIVPPPVFAHAAKSPIEKNVWVSFGKHDTGLHRDDSAGMLVVLKGEKQVTLYPSQDTPLLKPYSLVPKWASTAWPCKLSPNLFTLNEVLTRQQMAVSLPSARLLYESMASQTNKAALLHFLMLLHMVADAPLVWGCKLLASGAMRWEVYAYHFNYLNSDTPNTEKVLDLLLDQHPYARAEARHPNALLHSYDIENGASIPEILNGNVHVYKIIRGAGKVAVALPVFGEGTMVSRGGDVTRESMYVVGTRAQFTDSYLHFMNSIGFDEPCADVFKATILGKYTHSPMLCVHNKHDGNVFVQYLGIPTADFVQFLKDFSYPERLCTHASQHAQQYSTIPHEITIVFQRETLIPVRTAFYGTLTPLL